jgi:sulfite exporter TauE/SafE
MSDATLLLVTAAAIAALHTVLGPDHYLVFAAMGKARRWSLSKTLRVTALCGLGHIFGSIAIGSIGLLAGAQVARLVAIEGVRGDLASWALLSVGLVYFAWGLKAAGRRHEHEHAHSHGDVVHSHPHNHSGEHAHPHLDQSRSSITPWALFIVFVLGPCEALIPLFMYPAAEQSPALVISVAAVFGVVTLLTMLIGVVVTTIGLDKLRIPVSGRYAHATAGASIALCGFAMTFLGL